MYVYLFSWLNLLWIISQMQIPHPNMITCAPDDNWFRWRSATVLYSWIYFYLTPFFQVDGPNLWPTLTNSALLLNIPQANRYFTCIIQVETTGSGVGAATTLILVSVLPSDSSTV